MEDSHSGKEKGEGREYIVTHRTKTSIVVIRASTSNRIDIGNDHWLCDWLLAVMPLWNDSCNALLSMID